MVNFPWFTQKFRFPAVLSFLVKSFVQSDKERYDELLLAAEHHQDDELEQLLQEPQRLGVSFYHGLLLQGLLNQAMSRGIT